jgi:hypothetical protein
LQTNENVDHEIEGNVVLDGGKVRLGLVSEKFDPLNDEENYEYKSLIEELLVYEEREDEDGDNTGDELDRVQ